MGSPQEIKIPALTGQNFIVWRQRLEVWLDSQDVLMVAKEELPSNVTATQRTAWNKLERKAKHLIMSVVPDEYFSLIEGKHSAKEMLDSLVIHFSVRSVTQQTQTKREIFRLQKKEGDDLSSHFLKFDGLIRKLEAAGAYVSEEDRLSYLFVTLSRNYDAVTSALENMEDLTINVAKQRLLAEEIKQNSRTDRYSDEIPAAFRSNYNRRYEKFLGNCFNCGEIGHKSFKCPKREEKRANLAIKNDGVMMLAVKKENFQTNYVAMEDTDKHVAMVANKQEKINWVLDSGSSDHVCKDISLFESIQNLKCGIKIDTAESNISIIASKQGKIVCNSNKGIKLTMNDVLYVENLRYNLLSIKKLVTYGIVVIFMKNGALLKKNGTIIASASLKGDLYELDTTKIFKSRALLCEITERAEDNNKAKKVHKASGEARNNGKVLYDKNKRHTTMKIYQVQSKPVNCEKQICHERWSTVKKKGFCERMQLNGELFN